MIEKAIEILGGKMELAKAIDMSPPFLSQILKGVRPIPAKYANRIETVTEGKVKAADLRPDDFEWDGRKEQVA